MPKYLDQAGLTYLWGKLKAKFASLDSNGKVPTSQLPDGLPATIADGSVTEAKLDSAVVDKLNEKVTYTNHSVTVNYSAGTPGTRGQATALGFSSDFTNSHILVGFVVYENGSNATMRAEVVSNGTNIYLAVYRANTSAVSGQTIKVRLTWIPA